MKKRVTLEEMKHFYSRFLGEHLGCFVSSCFSFFLFPFLLLLISSCFWFFRCFYCSLHCFVRYFVFVLLPGVLRIWESVSYSQVFFTLHSFLTFGTICFYQGLPGARTLALKVAGLSTEVWNTDSTHLFESQSVRQLYDK